MDATLSNGAARLLDFIASFEAPRGYDTIFGNHQNLLPKKITQMTIDEVLANQAQWSARFGSSASGRYQFMRATLSGLKLELGLKGSETFDPNLQDRLAFRLLLQRGFSQFVVGRLSLEGFALNLAKEWASLPVLRTTQGAHGLIMRGQSYYAGDKLNKSLVPPERVEMVLQEVNASARQDVSPVKKPEDATVLIDDPVMRGSSTMMPDTGAKPWYLSKGVIGGVIAIALPIISLFFPAARAIDPGVATDWIVKILQIVGPVAGGLLAIYGRVRADQPIRGTEAEQKAETFLGGGNPALDLGTMLGPALQSILVQVAQSVEQGVANGLKSAPGSIAKS